MLTFAIEIPVKTDSELDALLDVAKLWIAGSPHGKIPPAQIESAFRNDGNAINCDQEHILVVRTEAEHCSLAGVQYSRVEKNALRWSTELIGRKALDDFRVAIRVRCDALVPATRLPTPKKPYIVRQVFTRLGGGLDGSTPVSELVHELGNSEIEYAAALIKGEESRSLPVVYVSALPTGGYLLNPRRLAAWLSGMAHVFVEPNRWFSVRLMHEVKRQNAYGGTIGIYWPNGQGPRKYFNARVGQSGQELGEAISADIRSALVHRQPDRELTWAFVEETRSARALEELRQKGSTELNEYVTQFDAESNARKAQLEDAEREIWRLRAEVRRLESESNRVGDILRDGEEIDLFPGERVGIVADALQAALNKTRVDSRRYHVLTDLISANDVESDREKVEAQLRAALEAYRTMDGNRRSLLEKLGFTVTEEGKHYKAVFMQDGRYTFSIPKTSSDHRAGMNLVSDIRAAIL